jgi:hypothetical protein
MKEKDKRLFIPKDDFEEEASEGLGRLSREEAEEDLRELRGRIDRRLRKPRTVWIPAAAAVVIILLVSVLYISIFREPEPVATEIAFSKGEKKDTAMIAMAEPLKRAESQSPAPEETLHRNVSPAKVEVEAEVKAEVKVEAEAKVEVKDEVKVEAEVGVEEEVAEVVIVEAMPMAEKAVSGVAAAQSDKKSRATSVATPNLGVATGIHQPEPVGGMEEYNRWLDRNIRYPEGVSPRVQQEVVITFTVAADSTLTDMKAAKTPGAAFTDESFRLLRDGPRWIPAMSEGRVVKAEVNVIIVFR